MTKKKAKKAANAKNRTVMKKVLKKGPPVFKKICLEIEETIYDNLRANLSLKRMLGDFYGIADEVLVLMLIAIEEGKETATIIHKSTRREPPRRK